MNCGATMNRDLIQKNLVFEGGGVLIVLYAGALTSIEQAGLLPQIKRAAGASTGAVMAMLVSLKLSAADIKRTLDDLDFSKIPQQYEGKPPRKWPLFEKLHEYIRSKIVCFRRLWTRYGYYSNEYFYNWLLTVVAKHTGNSRITFAEFRARGFLDLHVVVTNVSKHSSVVFSADTTPDCAIADAVRMSTAIPLYFEAMQFDGKKFGAGDYYCDGGFTNNYPLGLFDHDQYGVDNPYYDRGINWETLGLFHRTAFDPTKTKPITSLKTYMANMMVAVTKAADFNVIAGEVTHKRTIIMSDCGVQQTEFSMKPGDEKHALLFETGRKAAEDYLAAFKLPEANILA